MANKKISELASATTPLSGAELIEIVQSGTNKQVAASALIGAAGPEGDPGAPGADGLDGSDGADGRTVLSGPGAPSSGLGADGDFYIDTTDWDIYGPKTVGAWGSGTSLVGPAGAPGADGLDGSDGAAGADGADGVDGRTVLSGTGAPSSGLGANGDFYIDTTDWDIYGPKTAGAWGAGTSLIGSSAANLATVAHAATSKTPPVDADELSLIDSAASYGLKKLTWANLKATIWSSLGALIAGGTAKTTPVDGDGIAIADSAASSATKYLTLANLWTNLFKGKADALYAVIAKGVTNGDSHNHAGGDGAQIAYSGLSGLPSVREKLTATRNYYVRTDGSDSNDGLANTSGGAFLTIQKAIDTATQLDLSIYYVVINVADGTYTGALTLKKFVGGGYIQILGNTTTPANVHLNVTGICIFGADTGYWLLYGVKLTSTYRGIYVRGAVDLRLSDVDFGACTYHHMLIESGARMQANGNWSITGGSGSAHIGLNYGGAFIAVAKTCTITGTPALTYFVQADTVSNAALQSITFSGSATGTRYYATTNSVIQTYGGGATYLPGDVGGSTATGGQYA